MDRSYSRRATLIGGVATVGLLLAGCATTTPGSAVLGVPRSETSAPAQSSGNALAGLEQAITNELNAVNATQSGSQAPLALIELNALNSPSSLIKAENFEKLVSLGTGQLVKREQVVNALISEVGGNEYVSTVSVSGRSLRTSLLELLESVNGQLEALVGSISSATLTDVVRADVTSLNASTRVYGLVEPQVHLALAGGDMLAELNDLAGQAKTLAAALAAAGSTDPTYAKDLALLQDLNRQIPAAQSAVGSGLNSVLSLTAAGFPGNKASIVSARSTFNALRSPSGAIGNAVGDAAEISTDLGPGA
jgi:hypothetical protein